MSDFSFFIFVELDQMEYFILIKGGTMGEDKKTVDLWT
jgi:hypothetical protein